MDTKEHEYGKTKLTEAEWVKAAEKHRHIAYVLVVDGHVTAEGPWLQMVGAYAAEPKDGKRVRVMSHSDFVTRRLAECLLVSL